MNKQKKKYIKEVRKKMLCGCGGSIVDDKKESPKIRIIMGQKLDKPPGD